MSAAMLEVDDLTAVVVAGDARISPDGETIAYCVTSVDREADRQRSELRFASAGDVEPPDLATEGRAPRWAPDGTRLAFLLDREEGSDLVLLSIGDGSVRELASFQRLASTPVWSPAGDRIALSATIRAGSPSRIAILDTATGSMEVLPGEDDDDIAPSWSPDGTQLAFGRAPHSPGEDGPSSSIYVARVDGGDSVELGNDLAFGSCPTWSPDGTQLACYGTRDRRLGLEDPALQPWLVPIAGGPARPVAAGINGVIVPSLPEGPIWSGDGSIVFREARAGDINVVRVRADDPDEARALTRDCQVTSVSASQDGGRLAFSACTAVDPGSVYLHEVEVGTQRPAARRRRELALPVPTPVNRSFEGPDGQALDGWVQGLSRELAPQPLLVCMHGGPHNFVGSGFALGHFHRNVLAARGWIVLTLNSSGSGSYGEAFADSIRGRWGERDLPEYLSAVDALVAEGLVDPGRLAVAGYSYGGYLAAWAVCHTDRFKAAVIGAPITNLETFQRTSDIGAWYVPWEMGDSAADRERLERLSPVNHVERISTPTLILHGDADRRCPIGQGEELHARIGGAGRATSELVRYPGAEHLFYSQGRPTQRIDYNKRIVEWVEKHVLGSANGTVPAGGRSFSPSERAQEVRQ